MKNLVRLGALTSLRTWTQNQLTGTHRIRIFSDGEKFAPYVRLDKESVLLLQLKGIDWLPTKSLRDIQQEAETLDPVPTPPAQLRITRIKL